MPNRAAWTAFGDLRTVVGLAGQFNAPPTDARLITDLTGVPALVWALLWAAVALLVLALALWWTWGRALLSPVRRSASRYEALR